MGELYCSYAKIVDAIGEPSDMFDNYKSDAEWCLEFDNGMVATIYNWKNGKNYDPVDGLDKENIDMWHIGGKDEKAFHYIRLLLWGKAKAGGLGYPPPLYL